MDDDNYERIIFLADPELNEPVLVYALDGWIDAGLGATTAMGTLLTTIPTETLATFDTEYFIDQRARRPMASRQNSPGPRSRCATAPTATART